MVETHLMCFTTKFIEDPQQDSLMGGITLACQYLFNGKTCFAHCSTFITGRPDHPRLTMRIDEKPKPGTLAAPDQEFYTQVVLAAPRTRIQIVTSSIHLPL